MSRNFPINSAAALAAQHVRPITFVQLFFSSGTINLHNSIGEYVWSVDGVSTTFSGTGDLGDISSVEEGVGISPHKITLSLSGIDATIANAALNEDYVMRPVEIYFGVLDADDVLIDTPTHIWSGFMDQMNVSVGGENSAIQLTAESELARFDRSRNLRYTDNGHQARKSGDLFFEFLDKIDGIKVLWGDNSVDSGAGQPRDNPADERPRYRR